jgi:myosin V
MIKTLDPIWIFENNDWLRGLLIRRDDTGYLVESKLVKFYADKILTRNEDDIDCQNNLIDIPHLNEPSILNAINLRFDNNKIYTYTGKILISVNPFKDLDLYSYESMNLYKNNNLSNPHIYQIANNAFNNFIENQTILISGESGAGKTHATRSLMKYFALISKKSDIINIEEKVIQSNPILEAFGNAKTMRNDNSSRFGKFIKLEFNKDNILTGAQIETYLLEKIRVINQSKDERNFHIFYQLISSDEERRERYYLGDASEYKYLNNKYIYRDDGVEDEDDFLLTLRGMEVMGFSSEEIDMIFRIISSILHIGNIRFESDHIINKIETVDIIVKLLDIDSKILETSLLYRYLEVQGEIIKINLKADEVEIAKNSLSMRLYQNLFSFIVSKINDNLYHSNNKFIGILDIFGFESFKINRYEQLCINYTNERLQQQFNKYIFKLEQVEYEKEGIDWTHISFPDNQECLDLIGGKLGLIEMLDEENRIPNGNSKNFTRRFLRKYSNNIYVDRNKKFKDSKFSIKHYAGSVEYDTNFFYEKNRDLVSNEILDLLNKLSICPRLGNLTNIKKKKTVMIQFRKSLNELMKIINVTSPHYIRCIKPNDKNQADIFNRIRVNDQLKYSGILEAVKVARAGYPIRFSKQLFDTKYFMIPNYKNIIDISDFREGKTKIFLKMSGYNFLESMKKQILREKIIILQKYFRMFLIKNSYLKLRKKIIILQSFNRLIIAKNDYLNLKRLKSSILLQKNIRCYLQRISYNKIYSRIINIQKYYRKYKYKLMNNASIILQKVFRSYFYRKRYLYIICKVKLIQSYIRKFLKQQSKVKRENKKLQGELKRLSDIRQTELQVKRDLEENLLDLQNKATNAILEKKATEKDLRFLEEGMKRSINEKMILSQRLEDLMIENDRIRNMRSNNISIPENCLIM